MNLEQICILVVDDSKTFNSMMCNIFQGMGYQVFQAFTLKEAQEKFHTQVIDYVMLDLNLPDGSGVELIDFIKQKSTSKIIVMTGNEDSEFRDEIFKKGIIDYFIKTTPIQIIVHCTDTLIKTIEAHKNTNILTIDDSSFVRKFLKSILEAKGYNVYEATTADEAQEILKNQPIHLVLLDLIMPGIDGIQFLETIKADKYLFDIPVIIVSADDSRTNYARVLKQGANDFIKKPFIIEEILLKCDIHIKSYLNQEKILQQQSLIRSNKETLKIKNIYHRNLIEANLDPLVTISSDGKITDVNQATIEVTGVSKEILIGSDFSSYFTNPEEAKQGYEKVLKDGKVVDYPLELKNVNGTVLSVLYNASTYKDENGNIAGVFAAARDVTEINKLRKKIGEAEKLKSNSELISNIAHHWRQPLSIISTTATGMQLQKELGILDDEKFNEFCDSINYNAQNLSKIIDEFSNYLKNDFNDETLSDESSEIEKRNFISFINSILDNSHIYIHLDLKDDNIINGYPKVLLDCFKNIVNNSKDALVNLPEDERYLYISQEVVNEHIVISFKDNGGGIAEDILQKVFEPYFTTKHQYQGVGLGLSLVYNIIVTKFKGSIDIKNINIDYNEKLYKGLEVVIDLPMNIQ